jgi:hypothetical protein
MVRSLKGQAHPQCEMVRSLSEMVGSLKGQAHPQPAWVAEPAALCTLCGVDLKRLPCQLRTCTFLRPVQSRAHIHSTPRNNVSGTHALDAHSNTCRNVAMQGRLSVPCDWLVDIASVPCDWLVDIASDGSRLNFEVWEVAREVARLRMRWAVSG